MPYGKLAEGDRVFTAVAGPAASADINEIQDQLKAMCGPRWINCIALAESNIPTTTSWTFLASTLNPPLSQVTANAEYIMIPIVAYVGQVLTGARVTVSGATGATSGSMELIYAAGAAPTTQDLTGATANPWDTAGTAYANRVTYSVTGLAITIAAGTTYAFRIASSNDSSTKDNYLWAAEAQLQFGA